MTISFKINVFFIIFLFYNFYNIHASEEQINYIGCGDPGYSLFPEFKGLKMHIRCYDNPNPKKNGKPIAVFDSGMPFNSLIFANVIDLLLPSMPDMNIHKACFFDRYGYGWSDPSPYAFMANDTAYYLHESLRIANLQPPYIMAAWSWGSIDIQFFALKYMKEVVGMLTIDGTDADYAFDPAKPTQLATSTSYAQQFLYLASTNQIQNLTENGSIPLDFGFIPNGTNLIKSACRSINKFFETPTFFTTVIQELQIMIPSSSLLSSIYSSMNTNTPLSNLPLVVLSGELTEQSDKGWLARQSKMASLSNTHFHITVNSTHFIPIEKPSAIVDSLKILVNRYVDKFQFP